MKLNIETKFNVGDVVRLKTNQNLYARMRIKNIQLQFKNNQYIGYKYLAVHIPTALEYVVEEEDLTLEQ